VDQVLLPSPQAPAIARRALADAIDELGLPRDLRGDAALVLSELVSNAVVHGRGRVTVRAWRLGRHLRIEVIDEGTGEAPAIRGQGDGFGGHGLRLVDELSTRWGAHEGTTHVWADLRLP
jgi:anti-sigma regulatory factor (Ser/Thr protein kinase)